MLAGVLCTSCGGARRGCGGVEGETGVVTEGEGGEGVVITGMGGCVSDRGKTPYADCCAPLNGSPVFDGSVFAAERNEPGGVFGAGVGEAIGDAGAGVDDS